MNIVALFYFSLLPLCYNSNNAITINVKTTFSCKEITIIELVITNTTNDYYYSWIDLDTPKKDVNTQSVLKKYLYTRHGDFCLNDLLTENNMIIYDFHPIIGISFLKQLAPKDSFVYKVICREKPSCDILKHIYYVDDHSFEEICGSVVNNMLLYKRDTIVFSLP